jgi:hypothetical protein
VVLSGNLFVEEVMQAVSISKLVSVTVALVVIATRGDAEQNQGTGVSQEAGQTAAADSTTLASQLLSIKPTNASELRAYLNVARACVVDKDWSDAVKAVQLILDNKQDFFTDAIAVGPGGKKVSRSTSFKMEANSLLASMPNEVLDMYEQRFGALAKTKFVEASNTGNRELLAEVAQRYLHTKAGIEANDLLAADFNNHGPYFMPPLLPRQECKSLDVDC